MTLTSKIPSLGCAGLLAIATAAHADTIVGTETFTLTDGGSCCSPSPFGTVALTEYSNGTIDYVKVVETLATTPDPANFSASSGDALEFNVDVANTLSAITTGFGPGPHPDTAPPFTSGNTGAAGDFLESITCTACSGGNGPSSLDFTVTAVSGNLTLTDFTDVGTDGTTIVYNTHDIYFASDIFINGNTGDVGAYGSTPTYTPGIPEPSSLLLLGTGVLGIAGSLRRRMLTTRS